MTFNVKTEKANTIFYLGVEGGGTKSAAVLVNENLEVLYEQFGKALNYHSLNSNFVKRNLEELINPLKKQFEGLKVKAVFGLAGVDTLKDEMFYNKLVRSVLPKGAEFQVVNDTKIAIEARCADKKDRVIIIAGTGSNVYGENGKKSSRVIGWDYILGDEGSGYYFGLKALQAVTRAFDGRIERTELTNLLLEAEKSKSFEDFMPKFYAKLSRGESKKHYVASFAPLVDKAIERGDKEAIKMRNEGARELALGVCIVARNLDFSDKDFCFGTAGSQWKMPGFKEIFIEEVKKLCPNAKFSENDKPGVWGALLLAKRI